VIVAVKMVEFGWRGNCWAADTDKSVLWAQGWRCRGVQS